MRQLKGSCSSRGLVAVLACLVRLSRSSQRLSSAFRTRPPAAHPSPLLTTPSVSSLSLPLTSENVRCRRRHHTTPRSTRDSPRPTHSSELGQVHAHRSDTLEHGTGACEASRAGGRRASALGASSGGDLGQHAPRRALGARSLDWIDWQGWHGTDQAAELDWAGPAGAGRDVARAS